jgi:Flp pilus assembly protein TadD
MRTGLMITSAYLRATLLGAAALLTSCAGNEADSVVLRAPDTASRLRVAAAAAASGQTDIALSMYGAAAEAAPDNVEAQARFASLLIRAGKPELADQVLSQALGRKPSDPTLLLWLGIHRLETGAAGEALQIFDRLVGDRPHDVAALNGRGIALDLANRHADAQQTYREALQVAPSDLRSANNLAVSLLLDGRPAEARAVLLPLAHGAGVPPRLLNNLAIAQAAAGDVPGAEASLAGRPGAEDIRALATAFGAPPAIAANPPPEPGTSTRAASSAEHRSARPTG